jgi:hypothetical protein
MNCLHSLKSVIIICLFLSFAGCLCYSCIATEMTTTESYFNHKELSLHCSNGQRFYWNNGMLYIQCHFKLTFSSKLNCKIELCQFSCVIYYKFIFLDTINAFLYLLLNCLSINTKDFMALNHNSLLLTLALMTKYMKMS